MTPTTTKIATPTPVRIIFNFVDIAFFSGLSSAFAVLLTDCPLTFLGGNSTRRLSPYPPDNAEKPCKRTPLPLHKNGHGGSLTEFH